jgi:excisionase family DNA binding protein
MSWWEEELLSSREVPDLLTPREVARYLRMSTETVVRLCAQGRIPAQKVFGRWRIKRADLLQLLEEGDSE